MSDRIDGASADRGHRLISDSSGAASKRLAENAGLRNCARPSTPSHVLSSDLYLALALTDLHLTGETGIVTKARKLGLEPPQRLWKTGDLDRGELNAWVKETRRAALARARGEEGRDA